MSKAAGSKSTRRVATLKIRGRSFMALVLTPDAPVGAWLEAVDAEMARASGLFAERPVILDLGLVGAADAGGLGEALAARGIRVIAAENVPEAAEGLPPPLAGGRVTGAIELPPQQEEPGSLAAGSLLIEGSVRSGQQIVHAGGDVTIIGAVASGAEVMAGGSVHVYGALRGRAVAGFGGNARARIMCRRLHAELLAIDGFYLTADDMERVLLGAPAMARLDGEQLTITALE